MQSLSGNILMIEFHVCIVFVYLQSAMMVLEAIKGSLTVETIMRMPETLPGGPHMESLQQGASGDVMHQCLHLQLIPKKRQIINFLEHVFSETELSRDKFLQGRIEDSTDGFVPIILFLTYNRIAALNCSDTDVLEAARSCEKLEVRQDQKKDRDSRALPHQSHFFLTVHICTVLIV